MAKKHKVKCFMCKGSGILSTGPDYSLRRCTRCDGSGFESKKMPKCRFCRGAGKFMDGRRCNTCEGVGYIWW